MKSLFTILFITVSFATMAQLPPYQKIAHIKDSSVLKPDTATLVIPQPTQNRLKQLHDQLDNFVKEIKSAEQNSYLTIIESHTEIDQSKIVGNNIVDGKIILMLSPTAVPKKEITYTVGGKKKK